jgi:predicted alpha/beta-hydrolase family hydrolase
MPFSIESVIRIDTGTVRGWLHEAAGASKDALVFAHGAGSDCEAPLVRAVAETFASAGFNVLRIDLPYRIAGRSSPPPPASQHKDRAGIQAAVDYMREQGNTRIFLGGHSYGGRQSSMLAAESPEIARGLLLFSYPLHPPGQPDRLRTEHLPKLTMPCVFVHGTKDPFGSVEELRAAIKLIPAPTELVVIDKARHGVPPKSVANVTDVVKKLFVR